MEEDGIIMHKNRVFVPNYYELIKLTLKEMHSFLYVGHPRYQKTIATVRSQYFWSGMKMYVVDYTSRCMECQRVKDGQKHPTCFLHPFPIPKRKWEVVTIDFITKFPKTTMQHD